MLQLFRKQEMRHPIEMFALDAEVAIPAKREKRLGLIHNPRVNTVYPKLIIANGQVRKPNHAEVTKALMQLKKEVHKKLYAR